MAIRGGDKVAPPRPPPAGPCPWLVYYHGKGYKNQTFCCNITGPSPVKTYRKRIPALCDKRVLSCSYGRLVLYDDNSKVLSLCNSTTFDDTIILPSLGHFSKYKIDSCVLLPNNSTSGSGQLDDFKFLVFLENFPSIMCCRVGSNHEGWSEILYWKYLENLVPTRMRELVRDEGRVMLFRGAVACGGKIYAQLGAETFFRFYHSMWSIEIVEEEEEVPVGLVLSKLNVPAGVGMYPILHTSINGYMLESCGELFFLYLFSVTLVAEVYRMNFDTMVWERVKNVKDRAFFIGESYCLSCPCLGSGRIYFTKRKDQSLYCYDMHDESVFVSLPRPNLPTPWLSPPIWIMPQVLIRPEDDRSHQDSNINKQRRNSTTISILELHKNRDDDDIQLCNLPLDVLEQVSKHLIAIDYMNFRAVNRMCRSIAPPVNWRRALSGSETNYFPSPLLMFPDNDRSVYKFVDPRINSNNNYYLMRIPNSLQDHKVIRYCNQGWLLLSERDADVHLYNPFMGDIIRYACTPRLGLEESLFFFPEPSGTTDSCFLIGVEFFLKNEVHVSVIDDPGEEFWYDFELHNNRIFEAAMQTSPVLFEDDFYYLDQKGNLGKLKILPEGDMPWAWAVLDKPQPPAGIKTFHQNFLVECGGELISVFVGHVGKWVAVYKLSNQAWETMTTLGNYDLYLSPTSSFSVLTSGSGGLGGNKIYFPTLHGSEIVFFSLHTGKWHLSGSQDSYGDFYGTRWHPNSCWIKPTW